MKMTGTVDAHHHLWRYTQHDYDWIGDEMQVLKRDFLPEDLDGETRSAGIEGTVAVQARQTLEETRWLLECADETPAILGVVGWVDLRGEDLPQVLRELRDQTKLKGVRHVVQDEGDGFLAGDDFNRGIDTLRDSGLVYDLLIREHQLPEAYDFARRHPKQRIVLDHLGKPCIAGRILEPWRSGIMRLAECPNVSCKISGLVTEANWDTWTLDELSPYLDVALDAFGSDRLMAGSDWPVCLVASTYQRWWSTVFEWAGTLPEAERAAILGKNARIVYDLD